MPRRVVPLITGETYHVFNQTVGKEEVFRSEEGLTRIFNLTKYYRLKQTIRYSKFLLLPLALKNQYLSLMKSKSFSVDIYAFSFMPNHYHFLLKQRVDNGIKTFISNLQNSFAKYHNIKSDRNGSVFQSRFKAKKIKSNGEFIHVSRYIHLNPVTANLISFYELSYYPWNSYMYYLLSPTDFLDTSKLLEYFGSKNKFVQFIKDQKNYQRKLHLIKKSL